MDFFITVAANAVWYKYITTVVLPSVVGTERQLNKMSDLGLLSYQEEIWERNVEDAPMNRKTGVWTAR